MSQSRSQRSRTRAPNRPGARVPGRWSAWREVPSRAPPIFFNRVGLQTGLSLLGTSLVASNSAHAPSPSLDRGVEFAELRPFGGRRPHVDVGMRKLKLGETWISHRVAKVVYDRIRRTERPDEFLSTALARRKPSKCGLTRSKYNAPAGVRASPRPWRAKSDAPK